MKQQENDIPGGFYFSVEDAPMINAAVVFTTPSASVFREDSDSAPMHVGDRLSIMPWGGDNMMPFRIMDLVDADETMSTCMDFIREACYAGGLAYRRKKERGEPAGLRDFLESNSVNSVFLGQCADMKMFDFCVTVLILNDDNTRIVRMVRKNAAYCRFGVADPDGRIPYLAYANWRKSAVTEQDCEVIPVLRSDCLLPDLRARIAENPGCHKYAVVSALPKVSSTYYPIPSYGSIFRGQWYDIKRLIGMAKKAKLRNSAPIKYHIQVHPSYWDRYFDRIGAVSPEKQKKAVAEKKKEIIDFLTGAENSGKIMFSTNLVSPDGTIVPEVTIQKISTEKEGGDFSTDIQEAINMICFAMRVHSNLVGSVPGKAQTNNSGSDKRELYAIAQTLQKCYRDLILESHRLVCSFNGWRGVRPQCDIIQLTTLDKHKDVDID